MDKILKAKQVAEWLGIDVQRVYEITRRDLFPHIKIADRQYRYSETAIQKWLENGGNKETEAQGDKVQ